MQRILATEPVNNGSRIERDYSMNFYKVYGMTVMSELELPQLTKLPPPLHSNEPRADVSITLGEVADALPGRSASNRWVEVDGTRCLFRFAGVGRFLVEDGRTIRLQKEKHAPMDDAVGWLVGSVLAAATHQRGLVPLHMSALLSPSGVFGVTGDSGAGKSTTAAHLHRTTNWPLVSDDVCRVFESNGQFVVESGVNTVKLWRDALSSLGQTTHGLKRDLTRDDKFHAIEHGRFVSGTHPFKRLVKLEWGESFEVSRLRGRDAFKTVLNSVYRPELAVMCGNTTRVVQMVMELTPKLRVDRIVRPKTSSVAIDVQRTLSAIIRDDKL